MNAVFINMDLKSTRTAYADTGFFSKIVLEYLKGETRLQPFYRHPVSIEGIKAAMADRKAFPTGRKLLVDQLKQHYSGIDAHAGVRNNIELLLSENTFTVTTAHQPNIFTGHLYFIYKILHAVKLARFLKEQFPGADFVPVFYMGSEDADLDELGHFYINGIKHEWKTGQTGAVGRMKIDKALVKLLDEVSGELSIQPYGNEIIEMMRSCYTEGTTIEKATFKLLNALFGEYGLVVFLPDDPVYKKPFVPVVEKELKEQFSYPIVEETITRFPKEYKVQAAGRDLNMFYLQHDKRERIEKQGDRYAIVNTGLSFDEAAMMDELNRHPEKFSPNVILRPVFQEMLLPNIAFIGGGGELAYWLELKHVFAAVQVPFPVLVLRNSFLLAEEGSITLSKKLGFKIEDMFRSKQELLNILVKRDSEVQLSLEKEKQALQAFYQKLRTTAGTVDPTLNAHTEALGKQAQRKLDALEKKMLRAEKKKFEAQQRQLDKLKTRLFPHDNLQERIENLMYFYAKWGRNFIKIAFDHSLALEQEFVTLEEQ